MQLTIYKNLPRFLISNNAIAIAGDTIADTLRLLLEIFSNINIEYRYHWQKLPILIQIL